MLSRKVVEGAPFVRLPLTRMPYAHVAAREMAQGNRPPSRSVGYPDFRYLDIESQRQLIVHLFRVANKLPSL